MQSENIIIQTAGSIVSNTRRLNGMTITRLNLGKRVSRLVPNDADVVFAELCHHFVDPRHSIHLDSGPPLETANFCVLHLDFVSIIVIPGEKIALRQLRLICRLASAQLQEDIFHAIDSSLSEQLRRRVLHQDVALPHEGDHMCSSGLFDVMSGDYHCCRLFLRQHNQMIPNSISIK